MLDGILHGDPTLSIRGDMAVDCCRIVDPVLDAWRDNQVPLDEYPAGSAGPPGWPLAGGATTHNAVSSAESAAA